MSSTEVRTQIGVGWEDEVEAPPAAPVMGAAPLGRATRSRLLPIFADRRAAICTLWVDTLLTTASALYRGVPRAELDRSIGGLFDEFVAFLGDGNAARLGRLVETIACNRMAQGFSLADLEHAVGAVRVALLPPMIETFQGEPAMLSESISALMSAEELAAVHLALAFQEATTAELRAAHEQTVRAEDEKLRFCRDITRVVTHERLILCDHEDIPIRADAPVFPVYTSCDVREARHMAAEASRAVLFSDERRHALQICVGESGTNALSHAGDATFQVWTEGQSVTFRIADTGPGIEFARIPAAITAGHTTGSTLGMGFTLMLEMADVLKLATDHRGTVLQLTLGPTGPRRSATLT